MTDKINLTIRPATPADIEPLTALSYRTIRAKYPSVIGADTVEAYIASGAVPAFYRERNSFTRVAEVNGEPAGACAVKEGEIDLMMVALEYHRSGIGSALLEDGERRLFQTHDRIVLESFRDNLQANTFYEKHGWTVEKTFTMPDFAIPMVRMTKQR